MRAVLEPYGHTFGSSPRLTGYDRALLPRIVDIFVLEHCYAAVAARKERRSKRKGDHKYAFSLCLHPSHRKSGWFVIAGDRLTSRYIVISSIDNIFIVRVKPVVKAEILPVNTGIIRNTEPPRIASTGEYPKYRTQKCLKLTKAESTQCVKTPNTVSTHSMSSNEH